MVPSDFDRVSWRAEHSALVRRRANELRTDGWDVFCEEQNRFTLRGRQARATFGGKPDLVAFKAGEGLVEDCKTGTEKDSDIMQVRLYLYLMPLSTEGERLRNCDKLNGVVAYAAGKPRVVPVDSITGKFKEMVRDAVLHFAQDSELAKAPAYAECRWCDIAKSVCPERVERPPETTVSETDLF